MAGIEMEKLMELNTLVFSSLEFLFRYLPLFLLLFFAVPDRFKLFVLFSGSIVFYALGDPQYVFLLLGMALVNYLFGRTVGKGAKRWMAAAVACNVGLLVYFKLSNAFDASFLLPVGISFYTFKSLSYLADVYRKKIPEERSFLRLAAYLCMFPQIVSGPIMRYEDALKGLTCETYRLTRVEDGLKYLVAGLAAKVLIADRLGILWNDVPFQRLGQGQVLPLFPDKGFFLCKQVVYRQGRPAVKGGSFFNPPVFQKALGPGVPDEKGVVKIVLLNPAEFIGFLFLRGLCFFRFRLRLWFRLRFRLRFRFRLRIRDRFFGLFFVRCLVLGFRLYLRHDALFLPAPGIDAFFYSPKNRPQRRGHHRFSLISGISLIQIHGACYLRCNGGNGQEQKQRTLVQEFHTSFLL